MSMVLNEYESLVVRYISYKRAEGLRESTLGDLAGRLKLIGRQCSITCVDDIDPKSIEAWFSEIGAPGKDGKRPDRAAATRLILWKYGFGFFEWLVKRGDIESNPILDAPRPKHLKRDVRKKRRAYAESELRDLFRVARLRTLAEYGKRRIIGCKDKKAWQANPITLENIEEYADYCRECLARNPKELKRKETDGKKWELIFKCLLFTGMRWSELRTLEVRWVKFGKNAAIELDPVNEKNGNGNTIPLKKELADDLEAWVKDNKLKGTDKLLDMPHKGHKRIGHDLAAAGILQTDARGRSVDCHALRHTFGTFLVRAGVNVKVCQTAMRHSDVRMTLNLYSHCDESEVIEAVAKLPSFSEETQPESIQVAEPIQHPTAIQDASNAKPSGLTPEEEMILAIYRNRKQA